MDTPKQEDLPAPGYHWAQTKRPDCQSARFEIVYVSRRRSGETVVFTYDRSLPLNWSEILSWGAAVPPGPTTGPHAQIEPLAPVKLSADDRAAGLQAAIPWSVHVLVHREWAKRHATPRTPEGVAALGGFTWEEIHDFGPTNVVDLTEPRQPGHHFPTADDDEALALVAIIKDRLVDIEQHGYSERFNGEALALRSYGTRLQSVVERSANRDAPKHGLGGAA